MVANLGQMHALIKAHGAQAVLLAALKPGIAGAVFQKLSAPDFCQRVAGDNQVRLINDAFAEGLSDPGLKGDSLHRECGWTCLIG